LYVFIAVTLSLFLVCFLGSSVVSVSILSARPIYCALLMYRFLANTGE